MNTQQLQQLKETAVSRRADLTTLTTQLDELIPEVKNVTTACLDGLQAGTAAAGVELAYISDDAWEEVIHKVEEIRTLQKQLFATYLAAGGATS
jgi:hypothetical protein